eukprot:257971-Hanusia_phi.AAC.1
MMSPDNRPRRSDKSEIHFRLGTDQVIWTDPSILINSTATILGTLSWPFSRDLTPVRVARNRIATLCGFPLFSL